MYDSALKMYKSCEPLEGEDPELGRAVGAYPRGWCEHESVYLHMEYKYLLELLRAGLCEEFWKAARRALVAFSDPAVYGRSPLQGASFIVSSAYEDPRLHGQAFQARLSGVTVEFLHMWILAVAGEEPFVAGGDGVELRLAPRLPGWLFTAEACRRSYHDPVEGWREAEVLAGGFAFKLCGRTLVVYANPDRKDTWGEAGVRPVRYRVEYRDGRVIELGGGTLSAPHAGDVRAGNVRRLDVSLGAG